MMSKTQGFTAQGLVFLSILSATLLANAQCVTPLQLQGPSCAAERARRLQIFTPIAPPIRPMTSFAPGGATRVISGPIVPQGGALTSNRLGQANPVLVAKPKAAVAAVVNPFARLNPAFIVPRTGLTSVWRTSLFSSANVVLARNPTVAALPSCGSGQDGNCIAIAPERQSVTPSNDRDNENILAKPIERRRALVIGNTEYASPITSLPGTAKDTADISKALKDQGFEVVSIANANRDSTVRAFNNLIRTAGEDDSVIIYYAGHGHIHPSSASGYWLPADADVENPRSWISNADITRMLSNISAKQILLVSDSCFSGALTREAEGSDQSKAISANAILKRRSVAVISSGSEEPVADDLGEGNSPFASALLKKLNNINSTKEPLRAQSVLNDIRTEVAKTSAQTPQYGVLMSAGHNTGGDYLLGIK